MHDLNDPCMNQVVSDANASLVKTQDAYNQANADYNKISTLRQNASIAFAQEVEELAKDAKNHAQAVHKIWNYVKVSGNSMTHTTPRFVTERQSKDVEYNISLLQDIKAKAGEYCGHSSHFCGCGRFVDASNS